MVNKFIKKPVMVEAVKWDGLNLDEVTQFVDEEHLVVEIEDAAWQVGDYAPPLCLSIRTLEGLMHISKYDYIIKGTKGEFYPCKPYVFDSCYEQMKRFSFTYFMYKVYDKMCKWKDTRKGVKLLWGHM